MSTVVVVGSVNLDLIVAVPHLPAPGETLLGSDVNRQPGGKGGNQAVAAHRVGARTVLVAAVGDDAFGADVRTALEHEGLPLDQVTTISGAGTGTAMIVVGNDGENTIVVSPGANALLDSSALTGVAHILAPDSVLALQLEIPIAVCVEVARMAKRQGATVVLNAAPLPKLLDPTFADLLRTVDVLVVNEGEALSLADQQRPTDPDGWGRVAAGLHDLGPATVVVTLGAEGAVTSSDEGIGFQSAFRVQAVDTTGAGDGFCGALSAALAQGLPLRAAVRRGCAAGAIAATTTGAQSALPTATELTTFLTERTED